MTDVRLTALNPVDSQVYPVACNTSGELIVEQVAPDPDLTVTGDLTVNGTSTLIGDITADGSATFAAKVTSTDFDSNHPTDGRFGRFNWAGIRFTDTSGNNVIRLDADGGGSAEFAGEVNGLYFTTDRTSASNTVFQGYLNGVSTTKITADGSAEFAGDITCSANTKGLVLKSPNGTSYRLSVANDGTLSTSGV